MLDERPPGHVSSSFEDEEVALKILVISQYFWPEEFLINGFVKGLKARGHVVEVLTGLPNYPSGSFAKGYGLFGPYKDSFEGNTVYRTPLFPRANGAGWRLALNYVSFALFSVMRSLCLFREKYDCILVFQPSPVTVGIPGRVLKWITGAKLCLWVQDLWPESLSATGGTTNPAVLHGVGNLTKWIYRGCDAVMIQSKAFKASVINMGVSPDRIHYYPNWADDFFSGEPAVCLGEEQNLIPEGFRIMFAGNIGVAQDFETILSAAEITLQKNPRIQWVVIGDGRRRQWVESEIKARSLNNVHMLGRHPKKKMPAFFKVADAMLVSLKSEPIFALTIPSKIQAYFASAKPVLASIDGEGARVVIEAKAGLSVPAESPEDLATAALKMAKAESSNLNKMGENARKYGVQNFSLQKNLLRFEEMIRCL